MIRPGPANWTHRGRYMHLRHGVSPEEANVALNDPDAVIIAPDPASRSGRSLRVIGWSGRRILTVIVVADDGVLYGVNGWPANARSQRRYWTGGET